MSFKFKIVSLILSVSLIPYIFLMIYMGNAFQDRYHAQTQHEMDTQLHLTIETIDRYLSTLKRDMLFISRLDIMNDIYSKDVDRRISKLLETKKNQLHLEGNLYVVDNNHTIIASSNPNEILKSYHEDSFFVQKVHSSFDGSDIGSIVLDFSLKNIKNLFKNTKDRYYYIIAYGKKVLYKKYILKDKIEVRSSLSAKPNIEIVLVQNKDKFLTLLTTYKRWFAIALFLGLVIISLISLYFVNRLIRPIIELSKVTDEITKNQDYSYRVEINADDEVGRLSASFNKMITSMNSALTKLKDESKNRERLIEEQSKSEMLKELSEKLSRYLSPQIYHSIFTGDQDVTLTSKRKKLTIFFSDIVGFTDTTDTMESEDLSDLLNDYLNEMTIVALKHGATIDKYIGDSIMLFFGDPYSQGVKNDAISCIDMALEMRSSMDKLHIRWKERGFTKPFKMRIGIHTGYCTVGNFGSKDRLEYTIIGTSVNIASRIESTAKPDEILISEETKLLIEDRFESTKSAEIIPKGFKRAISLYRVDKIKQEKKPKDKSKHRIDTIYIQDGDLLLTDEILNNLSHEEKVELKSRLNSTMNRLRL